MEQLQGFDFFPLEFNADGELRSVATWKDVKGRISGNQWTDAVFIGHGFRNSEREARSLYEEFLRTFRQNMTREAVASRLSNRRFAVVGVFWPSKAFRESFGDEGNTQSADETDAVERDAARVQLAELRELARNDDQRRQMDEAMRILPDLADNPQAQDEFVRRVLSVVEERESDPSEGFDRVRSTGGAELLEKLSAPVILPLQPRAHDEGGTTALDPETCAEGEGEGQFLKGFFGSVFGRAGQFLNLTTWYVMKNRAGVVGANGVATCVREMRREHPELRVHLVGHSLGGRLMASCAKALGHDPDAKVASLTLLQAAFSHFGLSADNREGTPGFFRDVIDKAVVTGPMTATFSFQDTVVGKAYAIASRLAGDNVKAVGDAGDSFGGIGRNGAQNLEESASERLHDAGVPYTLQPHVVHCLDGSGGLITDHGDVKNERVTWVFACAVAET